MTVPLFKKVEIGVDENGVLVVSDDGGKSSKQVTGISSDPFDGGTVTHTIAVDPAGEDEPALQLGESTEPANDATHAQLFVDPEDGQIKAKLRDGTVITFGMESNSQSAIRWGYDRLLFSKLNVDGSSGSIFHSDSYGKNVLRVTPELPDWDADTDYVIGDRVKNADSLYVATSNNTNSEPPSGDWGSSAGFLDYFPGSWEPTERKKIVFTRYDNDSGRYDIAVCDSDTHEVTILTADEEFGATNPVYSPDGLTILYCRFDDEGGTQTDLRAMDVDGSNKRTIIESEFTSQKWALDALVQWSPDGERLCVTNNSGHINTGPTTHGIYVCDADGSNLTRIVSRDDFGLSGTSDDANVYSVSWGANNLIIFTIGIESDWGFNIWSIRPDGTELTKITNILGSDVSNPINGYYWAVWTPDASKWLVVYGDGSGIYELRLVNIVDTDEYITLATTEDGTFDGYPPAWGMAYDKVPWGSVDMRRVGRVDSVVRVVKVEGEWPERPDVLYVEWVGPGPSPPADVDNDTWVETGV